VGGKLLESALKEIVAHGQIAKVKLTVNPKQRAAVKLYRKAGFKEVGRLHRELKVDGRYYDEIIMEKQVSR